MSIIGRKFPNQTSATNATNAAKPSWVAPSYSDAGGGRHANTGALPVQEMTGAPIPLLSGQWLVTASHPGFQSDVVESTEIDLAAIWPVIASLMQAQVVR